MDSQNRVRVGVLVRVSVSVKVRVRDSHDCPHFDRPDFHR